MSIELYVPTDSVNLKDLKTPAIRLGLQGYPGKGKTWSALTFPNPIIFDLDNKLSSHRGKDIPVLPFYSAEWRKGKIKAGEELHDMVYRYLNEEAIKFRPEQTLIIDSFTTLSNWFQEVMDIPYYSGKGQEDGFKFWNLKLKYNIIIAEAIKRLTCNVVFTCHEQIDRNEKGIIVGIKPLTQGQFSDQVAGNFTDWFRCVVEDGKYLWQVRADHVASCYTTTVKIPLETKFVEANYSFFKKYFDAEK